MENSVTIRPAREEDYGFVLRVNRENVEVLSPLEEEDLRALAGMAELFLVAEADGMPAAFLLALNESAGAYGSENYRWFKANCRNFLYVDRIVTDGTFRRRGIGKQLYEAVFRHAGERGYSLVTAEIDTVPYNGDSLLFHRRMGFREIGTQAVRNGTVQVSLQARPVRQDGPCEEAPG